MIPTASVSIDRTSLSLSPLVISNTPGGTVWLEDFQLPAFAARKRYAPDSAHVPGSRLLTATLEAAELPLTINVRGASPAATATLQAEVEAALSQFSYDLTLTVDGVATVYEADFSWPRWTVDSGMVQAHLAKASVTIQINPPGA